ncbi:MAG: 50S ribosomal protein L23 [Akkermansiaceae bacterium]|nr:50S ribosomal protein L23 [Akkermansiaceae bacterium]NNM28341.1 50S ribosomal protein L23 [Akkermansiaceae bacterium]
MRDIYSVIETIQLAEKATYLQELNNDYVFKVNRKANKLEIKRAVEQAFGVKVTAVRTCNYQGKKRRQRRSDAGKTAQWKKAIVRLKDGDTIDLV